MENSTGFFSTHPSPLIYFFFVETWTNPISRLQKYNLFSTENWELVEADTVLLKNKNCVNLSKSISENLGKKRFEEDKK